MTNLCNQSHFNSIQIVNGESLCKKNLLWFFSIISLQKTNVNIKSALDLNRLNEVSISPKSLIDCLLKYYINRINDSKHHHFNFITQCIRLKCDSLKMKNIYGILALLLSLIAVVLGLPEPRNSVPVEPTRRPKRLSIYPNRPYIDTRPYYINRPKPPTTPRYV